MSGVIFFTNRESRTQPSHLARILELGEEQFDRAQISGKHQVRRDFGQRSQDETALMKSRMRNYDLRVIQHEIPGIQDVEINCSRGVSWSLRGPAHCLFNLQQPVKQSDRRPAEIDFDHRIEIGRRAWLTAERGCLVDR
jgi:hypothetical protein